MSAAILKLRNPTPEQRLGFATSAGRRSGATPSSWVSDLMATHRSILLCTSCQPKYRPALKREGYEAASRPPLKGGVIAMCDDCKEPWAHCINWLAPRTF